VNELVGNEFQICGAEMRKVRDPQDRLCYAVALQASENPMSAETWSADSIVTGQ